MTLACDDGVGGFLTASALLAAILLVWLGFWVHARPTSSGKAATQDTKREEQFRACLGIAWVCLAIVFVFIACAWAFWDCSTGGEGKCISRWAVSFGMTAFFMAGYAILESLSTAALVLLGKAELDKPTAPAKTEGQKCHWIIAMLTVVAGLFLVSLGLTHPVSIPWCVVGAATAVIGTAFCVKWKVRSLKKPPEQGSSDENANSQKTDQFHMTIIVKVDTKEGKIRAIESSQEYGPPTSALPKKKK